MGYHKGEYYRIKAYSQFNENVTRYIDPSDISLSSEYKIEVFAFGLDCPIGMAFSDEGDLFIADSGLISGNSKVLRLTNNRFEIIAEKFNVPITGINYLDGNIYVSNKGNITVIRDNGTRQDILSGLLCNGDYGSSNVAFGPNGKIYFGQGTVTNSGVVGSDNPWVYKHPLLHDEPAANIVLTGQNFESNNMLVSTEEKVLTGAFSPYGVPNVTNEIKKGVIKASGSILRANRDGTELELLAWGLRNPVHIGFDREFRLFAASRSYDVRGSRPIANAPDEFHIITPGMWYGWPDYCAGEPVTLPKFAPEGRRMVEFLLLNHPNLPPKPIAEFQPHSSIMGFDFNYNNDFGRRGDVYIAEYGTHGPLTMGRSAPYDGIGFRVSRIEMPTGQVSTFASNKSGLPASFTGGEGFGRLVDVKFGPDGNLYILDCGINDRNNPESIVSNTGVIWKITRS